MRIEQHAWRGTALARYGQTKPFLPSDSPVQDSAAAVARQSFSIRAVCPARRARQPSCHYSKKCRRTATCQKHNTQNVNRRSCQTRSPALTTTGSAPRFLRQWTLPSRSKLPTPRRGKAGNVHDVTTHHVINTTHDVWLNDIRNPRSH